MSHRDDVVVFYTAYLTACNRRDWDVVATCVADHVLVNGVTRTRMQYVADILAITRSFPDYRWELRRTVVEGDWIAVRLSDQGTRLGPFRGAPGDATQVATTEFNMYRVVNGSIVEVEGTADNAPLCT